MLVEKNSLRSFLANGFDSSTDKGWTYFINAINGSKPEPLDRKAIKNLRTALKSVNNQPLRIQGVSDFFNLMKGTINTECASDLAIILNESLENPSDETRDLILTLKSICLENATFSIALLEDTCTFFSNIIMSKRIPTSNPIVHELFLLAVVMISQKGIEADVLRKTFSPNHIKVCYEYTINSVDSAVQISILEWIWRMIKILKISKETISEIMGNETNEFFDINMYNFRSGLHSFLVLINSKKELSDSSIIHLRFDYMFFDESKQNCVGYIDFNHENVLIYFYVKPLGSKWPDAIVFNLKNIFNYSITKNSISFSTNEGTKKQENPTKTYSFQGMNASKQILKEISRRFKSIHGNGIPKNSEESMKMLSKPSNNRISAFSSTEMSNIGKNKIVETLYSEKPSKNDNQGTEDTEKKIEVFHSNTLKILSDMEARATSEIGGIINRLVDHEKVLRQLSEQHKILTDTTSKENSETSNTIKKLSDCFQTKQGETKSKRDELIQTMVIDIAKEKDHFLDETNHSFQNNAIVRMLDSLTLI